MNDFSFKRSEQASADKMSAGRKGGMVPKKYVFGGLVGLACLTFGLVAGFNRGYESKKIGFQNFGSTSQGTSIGSKSLFLRKGQAVIVDYDVQVEHGGLYVHLFNSWDPPGRSTTENIKLVKTGSGQRRIPVSKTGLYRLSIKGSPDGTGYDVSYTVYWKVE